MIFKCFWSKIILNRLVWNDASNSQKGKYLVNMTDEEDLPIGFLQEILIRERDIGRITLSCVIVVGAFFLEAQSHQLCSIKSPRNCFLQFERLIIQCTKLLLPTGSFFYYCRCWTSGKYKFLCSAWLESFHWRVFFQLSNTFFLFNVNAPF